MAKWLYVLHARHCSKLVTRTHVPSPQQAGPEDIRDSSLAAPYACLRLLEPQLEHLRPAGTPRASPAPDDRARCPGHSCYTLVMAICFSVDHELP